SHHGRGLAKGSFIGGFGFVAGPGFLVSFLLVGDGGLNAFRQTHDDNNLQEDSLWYVARIQNRQGDLLAQEQDEAGDRDGNGEPIHNAGEKQVNGSQADPERRKERVEADQLGLDPLPLSARQPCPVRVFVDEVADLVLHGDQQVYVDADGEYREKDQDTAQLPQVLTAGRLGQAAELFAPHPEVGALRPVLVFFPAVGATRVIFVDQFRFHDRCGPFDFLDLSPRSRPPGDSDRIVARRTQALLAAHVVLDL